MKMIKFNFYILSAVFIISGCGTQNNEIEVKRQIGIDTEIVTECQANECQGDDIISESIDAMSFKEKLDTGEYILIDIRTQEEYENERIADVQNIDIYSDNFDEWLNILDKDKKYLIYCRSGSRTKFGLQRMRTLGFSEVYDLDGGINKWKKNKYKIIDTK